MSVVRPEFGPTLPELLAPRIRALPRIAQVALAVLAAVVVVLAALFFLRREENDGRLQAVVREPIAYNLVYPRTLARVAPQGRETLRLQTPAGAKDPQSFAVTPYTLPPYKGDSTRDPHAHLGEHDQPDAPDDPRVRRGAATGA